MEALRPRPAAGKLPARLVDIVAEEAPQRLPERFMPPDAVGHCPKSPLPGRRPEGPRRSQPAATPVPIGQETPVPPRPQ